MGLRFGFSENIAKELNQVHQVMIAAYSEFNYSADVVRAQKMESILRKIKNIDLSLKPDPNDIISIFDRQCYEIAKLALDNIKTASGSEILNKKHLLMNAHGKTYQFARSLKADDIAEIELSAFIQAMEALAIGDIEVSNIDITGKTTGRRKGNLQEDVRKLISNSAQEYAKKIIDKVQNTKFKNKAYESIQAKMKDANFKSIKTDVFSFDIDISAQLKPEWEAFDVFKGAKFTVKNYLPKRKNNVAVSINFGSSNPYKGIVAQLMALGYSGKQSQHIFYHSLYSWINYKSKIVETHIPHLRFAYELAGGGLYDETGAAISEADFLIVNDPTSYDGIYVRSTKAMIGNALKRGLQSGNPFISKQYVMYADIMSGKI